MALFLDKSGQAFNVALYNSGFAKVLTEAAFEMTGLNSNIKYKIVDLGKQQDIPLMFNIGSYWENAF